MQMELWQKWPSKLAGWRNIQNPSQQRHSRQVDREHPVDHFISHNESLVTFVTVPTTQVLPQENKRNGREGAPLSGQSPPTTPSKTARFADATAGDQVRSPRPTGGADGHHRSVARSAAVAHPLRRRRSGMPINTIGLQRWRRQTHVPLESSRPDLLDTLRSICSVSKLKAINFQPKVTHYKSYWIGPPRRVTRSPPPRRAARGTRSTASGRCSGRPTTTTPPTPPTPSATPSRPDSSSPAPPPS